MSNWVNGRIIPYGSKEQVESFKKYVREKKKWKGFIDRNCPPNMEKNEIHIYCNNALSPVLMTEELEEIFRNINFKFYVCDEMNQLTWDVIYENGEETTILLDEDRIVEKVTNKITDEYIAKRKEIRKQQEEQKFEPC